MLIFIPELFCLISSSLNDKEKIFLISCSKKISNFRSLLILNSRYDLEEVNDKYIAKNIIIKNFSLEGKIRGLIENLIPESIIVHSKYVKFISNNTNIKLFHDKETIKKIISYESNKDKIHSYLAMKIMLNNDEFIKNINKQFYESLKCGYLNVTKLLINLGADIHNDLYAAIVVASCYGHLDIVKLLINHGANAEIRNNQAIINASGKGHLSVVEFLISLGVNVHAQNNQAVIFASCGDHLNVVELLIKHGANIHAQDNEALVCASCNGNLSVVKLLIKLRANINSQNNGAIIYASQNGRLDVVKLLINSGANINARDNQAIVSASCNGSR